jgi:uncharacterized protein YdeI (YjbR/CyaY-like superfamily)
MGKKTREVDAYIAKAAPFARPILQKIRTLYHKACPEVEEVMKWSVPHFEYKGVLGGMAAFKEHASFGFWKASLMRDPLKLFDGSNPGMGGRKVTDVAELPDDKVLLEYMREAIALNEQGAKVIKEKKPKKELEVPDYLLAALKKNKKARAAFEAFSPSHKREYIEWITEAKQEATRERRLAQALEWMAQGKPRNWKYMNC